VFSRWEKNGGQGHQGPFDRGSKPLRRWTGSQSSAPSSHWFPILDCSFCSQVFKSKSIANHSVFTSTSSISYQLGGANWCTGRHGVTQRRAGRAGAWAWGNAVGRRCGRHDRVSEHKEQGRSTDHMGWNGPVC
jgi:hypothetical protein